MKTLYHMPEWVLKEMGFNDPPKPGDRFMNGHVWDTEELNMPGREKMYEIVVITERKDRLAKREL